MYKACVLEMFFYCFSFSDLDSSALNNFANSTENCPLNCDLS